MRVILTEDIPHVGSMGEIVRVADGYGRNYLIPQGLAVQATEQRAKAFEHQMKMIAHKKAKIHREASELVGQLEGKSIQVARQAGDDDRLYGSVTNRDIQEALEAEGFAIDKRKIVLDKPLRELGVYRVAIKLATDVVAHVKIWVVAA